MNIFLLAVIISMIFYLGIGWYVGRKVRDLDDYYVAGRNAPTLLIVGTLVASFMSTNAFLGELGMSYSGHAPLIIIMTAGNCLGYLFGAIFFGRYLRRSQSLTVPEFFGRRYQSRRLQALAGFTIIIGLTCYLLAVTWGIALVVSKVTQLPYAACICLVWLGYTSFTLYSGSKGVIITDTVMFMLFTIVAMMTLYFIIQSGGGWSESLHQLARYEGKPGIIAWHGLIGENSNWKTPAEALIWALILGCAWGVVVAVSPWQTSRYLMARDEHVVVRSGCGACVAMFLLYLINNYSAAAVNLINPEIDPPESVMIWVSMNLLPPILGSLLICGILSAGLSSASTFLSLIGFSASNDIFIYESNPQKKLLVTRYKMVVFGLIVITLCLLVPSNIFWITYFAGPVFASSWGVVAFMSVWSRSITEAAAFWGMINGFFGNIATNLFSLAAGLKLPVYMDPILVGGLFSLVTVLGISKVGTVREESLNFREKLHEMPMMLANEKEIARTLIWPKVMIVIGVATMILMLMFYALPYREAIEGTSSVTTLSGEMILAISYGLVMITGGGFVFWQVKKYFREQYKSNP